MIVLGTIIGNKNDSVALCLNTNTWVSARAWIAKCSRCPGHCVGQSVSLDANLHDYSLIWLLIVADESPAVTGGSDGAFLHLELAVGKLVFVIRDELRHEEL